MIKILHLKNTDYSQERFDSFTKEMIDQQVDYYEVYNGVHDTNKIRAISRGHKNIVADAKIKGLSEACIMEDDAYFLAPGAYKYYLANKPYDYDIYLGSVSNVLKTENNYITDFRGLMLYTIHERFYDKFLSIPENVNIDAGLKSLGKYYLCPKIVCGERPGYSYHRKKKVDRTHLLKQYPLYEEIQSKEDLVR